VGGEHYSRKIVLRSIKFDKDIPAFQVVQISWRSNVGCCCCVRDSIVINGHVWRSTVIDVEQLLQNEVVNNIVLA
jgi:hypothetical protein